MPNKIKAKELIKKLKQKDKRERISLYLSQQTYKEFKKTCDKEGVKASQVMEKLMEDFMQHFRK